MCDDAGIDLAELMIRREMELFGNTKTMIMEKMAGQWAVMRRAAGQAVTQPVTSMGGLIGGEAKRLAERLKNGMSIMPSVQGWASAYAMSVMEVNAGMGLIVAAPTAGSAGVIPGAFAALQEEKGYDDACMTQGLFVAAAIGLLIMSRATVAGAEGGCQAEIGTASAMASAGLVYLAGGDVRASCAAASAALANLLGLVCDPVGGLVELPCQRRNAVGAANAICTAESALAGIAEIVPLDEMIDVLYDVGKNIPESLRETAQGGMAIAPSAARRCRGCGTNG